MDRDDATVVTMVEGRMVETNVRSLITVIYPPVGGGKAVWCAHRPGANALEAHGEMVARAEREARLALYKG